MPAASSQIDPVMISHFVTLRSAAVKCRLPRQSSVAFGLLGWEGRKGAAVVNVIRYRMAGMMTAISKVQGEVIMIVRNEYIVIGQGERRHEDVGSLIRNINHSERDYDRSYISDGVDREKAVKNLPLYGGPAPHRNPPDWKCLIIPFSTRKHIQPPRTHITKV